MIFINIQRTNHKINIDMYRQSVFVRWSAPPLNQETPNGLESIEIHLVYFLNLSNLTKQTNTLWDE